MDKSLIFIAGILLAGAPLLLFEFIARKYKVSPELTRKSVHVLVSIAVVCMTFFLSLYEIALISALFLVFFVATRKKQIWKSIYRVKRKTYGEIYFTVGVITASLLAQDERIFAVAVLIMGISDTVAAIIGQHYPVTHKLPGSTKTVEGSMGFFLTSVFLLGLFGIPSLWTAIAVALLVTYIELVSLSSLDNITVPLSVVILLNFI